MRCRECGSEMADGSQFCVRCGAPAAEQPSVSAGPAAHGRGTSVETAPAMGTGPPSARAGEPVTGPGPQVAPAQQPAGAGSGGSRLRQVLLSLVPIVSLGFLSFVPFLYIALTRRRRQDWLVCAGYAAVVIVTVILVGAAPPTGWANALGGFLILLLMGVGAVHSFVALRPGGPAQAARARRAGSGQPDQHAVLQAAKDRMRQRAEARKLAGDNPVLARDLKIGRPDLERSYDDGGLVDVNHVGADILVRYLDLSPGEAEAVIAARGELGRFSSCPEVLAYANLPPDRLDGVSDLMIFG
jgi:DNA uptake protein ComE-like DNA-binding protein